jgi:hypothetical protein
MYNRADDKLKKVISGAEIDNQQFGKVDDLVSYLKEEAAKSSISPEEVDKLALKVAVKDNVLTQSAVNLLAKYSEGDLKNILSDIDIYRQNLKTWTDLQEYIDSKTGGKITPSDLNRVAADILTNTDPAIALIKEKILAYSENSGSASAIRQSTDATEKLKIKQAGIWMKSFYGESLKNNFQDDQFSKLIASISTYQGTKAGIFASDLAKNSDEAFSTFINSLNLKKEKISSPESLILYILQNKGKGNISDESVFNGIANQISSANIPVDKIRSRIIATHHCKLWYIWLIAGAGIIFIFFFLLGRKRDKDKENKD